jgi:histidyl-tRNA synthetase
MPRPKIPPPEYLLSLDRLPSRERMFDKLRKSLIELADYYGFDKIYTPVIDDARALQDPYGKRDTFASLRPALNFAILYFA